MKWVSKICTSFNVVIKWVVAFGLRWQIRNLRYNGKLLQTSKQKEAIAKDSGRKNTLFRIACNIHTLIHDKETRFLVFVVVAVIASSLRHLIVSVDSLSYFYTSCSQIYFHWYFSFASLRELSTFSYVILCFSLYFLMYSTTNPAANFHLSYWR